MVEYRIATLGDLERIWNMNIADNPNDKRWLNWKEKYINYNLEKKAVTFVVAVDGNPIGEGTLLVHPNCDAVKGKTSLVDGKTIANVNALRIRKEHENQGHISNIIKLMEDYSIKNGIETLTIGVEAKETRNLAIYLHWGFKSFIFNEVEDDELILYFKKELKK